MALLCSGKACCWACLWPISCQARHTSWGMQLFQAIEVEAQFYGGNAEELLVQADLKDHVCQKIPAVTGKVDQYYVLTGTYKGEYWIHDPRFSLFDNTVQAPRADGGGSVVKATAPALDNRYQARCASAPMTFLNEAGKKTRVDKIIMNGNMPILNREAVSR